jgi:hypothetical protein
MRILKIIIILIYMSVVFTTAAYAAEANFSASLLTANDVNCTKCHADTPHVIHAKKSVDCVNCHGDKLAVAIPICTKCHDGPIHKVHAGKVNTQKCEYCHKTITAVHNNLMADAVCSHCHTDLIDVHGKDTSCVKCHKSLPGIVKPLKSEGMVLICENCHASSSVATIHGAPDNKTGCYLCHAGTSKATGSEVPHVIHATKVDCKECHQENGQVVTPKCTRCHEIDQLHAFGKIGKLTAQTGLNCEACHSDTTKLSAPKTAPVHVENTPVSPVQTASIENTPQSEGTAEPKTPGFEAIPAIGLMLAGYLIRRRGLN